MTKDTIIYASYNSNDIYIVSKVLKRIKNNGWQNIKTSNKKDSLKQSDIAIIFLSKAYVQDEKKLLNEFAYIAVVERKPFIPVWLDSLKSIQQDNNINANVPQHLSVLEMLTAKYEGVNAEDLIFELDRFDTDALLYTPSTPQVCEKPCEIYEGDEPRLFISYAHDDANRVYPIIKNLYEAGWDLWYDEGIKTTERFLAVTAHSLKRSSVFVLMITNRALERPFIMNYELAYAKKLEIPIVPVLLEKINPQEFPNVNAEWLMEIAVEKDILIDFISTTGLTNRGTRIAVPPVIRHNMIYDVVLPPELPGYEISVQGNEITIIEYIGNDTEINIPSSIKTLDKDFEFNISFISNNAFGSECSEHIESIVIPESVSILSFHAFSGCKSLKNLVISDSVKYINRHAEWDVYFFVHKYCPNLGIVFNASKTILFHYPENGIETDYTIPNTVKRIDNDAFSECKSIRSINIPKNVVGIGNNTPWGGINDTDDFVSVFWGCYGLKSINIDNEHYISEDGVVFNKNKDTLIYCPSGKLGQYAIPHSVINIKEGAFRNSLLTSIIFPIALKSIDNDAFRNSSLVDIVIPNSVINIGSNAFSNCYSLKSVIMSENITTLPNHIFCECKSLENIKLSDNITKIEECAFVSCHSLSNINLPQKIESLGINAFTNTPVEAEILKQISYSKSNYNYDLPKNELEQENIPNSIEEPRALICCTSEDMVRIGQIMTGLYWEGYNFYYKKTINQEMIENSECILVFFSDSAFKCKKTIGIVKKAIAYDISQIIQIFIDDCDWSDELKRMLQSRQAIFHNHCTEAEFVGLIRDGLKRFNCVLGHPRGFNVRDLGGSIEITRFNKTGFPHVVIPNVFFENQIPVTSIGNYSFYLNYSEIKSVVIPDTVTRIGDFAFSWCTSLTNILIPKNVKYIGECSFMGCGELIEINVDSENAEYISMDGVLFNINITNLIAYPACNHCVQYVIPKTVTNIEKLAFRDAHLISITMQEGLLKIAEGAFYGCNMLKSIIIPNSVLLIGKGAFENCYSLSSVVITNSVENIEKEAFNYCSKLTIYTVYESTAWKYAEENKIKHEVAYLYAFEIVGEYAENILLLCKNNRSAMFEIVFILEDLGEVYYFVALKIDADVSKITDIDFSRTDLYILREITDYTSNSKSVMFVTNSYELNDLYNKFCEKVTDNNYVLNVRPISNQKNLSALTEAISEAQSGNAETAYKLGELFFKDDKYRTISIAIKWYLLAGCLGSDNAYCKMGIIWDFGLGVNKNFVTAIKWYEKAVYKNASAQCNLGYIYQTGKGTVKDVKKAFELYTKSAVNGNNIGQSNLASMYENGEATKKDEKMAVYWFEQSSKNGNKSATFRLAVKYYTGKGVAKNYKKAYELFFSLQDDGVALSYLATMHLKGKGCKKDYQLAVKYIELSAEKNNVYSQYLLGIYYLKGKIGLAKNTDKAEEWLSAAANNGHYFSQAALIVGFYNGMFRFEKDFQKAEYWYKKAVDCGNTHFIVRMMKNTFEI